MNLILLDLTPFIIAGSVAGGILLLFLIYILIKRAGHKKKKVEPPQIDDKQWLIALGDKENIKAVTVRGSRLSLELVDDKKINRESLTSLGVKSIITMSNKLILVIENQANEIANRISSNLQK